MRLININLSNNNTRQKILNKSVTNELQSFVGSKSSFGLYVSCEVNSNDKPFEIGNDFAEKYRKMLQPLFWMVNKLDSDLGVSNAQAEQNRLLSNPSHSKGLWARLNKLPMSFELKPPSLGAGLGIGYATSQNGTITYELDGRLIANPIIGANVKLDILALGSKFKPWGTIIDALDLVSWLTNLFSGGSVELNYELYFQLSAEIKLVGTGSKDGKTKPAHIVYNFADKKSKGDIALQGYLEGKFAASISLEIYVKKKKKRSFEAQYSKKQDMEKAAKLGLSVEGKSFVTLTLGKNFGVNNNWDADFYFSGFTIKITFSATIEKEKLKEKNIIPSVEGKLDLLKGKFELKKII